MSDKKISERVSKLVSSIKRRRDSKIPDRTNGDQYYYVHEFEQANEKLCIQYDKRNEEIYQKNLKIFNDINKKLINTPFNIDNKPAPPKRPTNYERLHLWKKRNVKISAHNQSIAILYLMANNINIKLNDYDNGVEPFEAVSIAEKISMDKNENMFNVVNSFLPTLKLKNDIHNKYKKQENVYNIEYPLNHLNNKLSSSEPNLTNTYINELDKTISKSSNDIYNSNHKNNNNNYNTNYKCSNPEHHSVNHKINHFNSTSLYPDISGFGMSSSYPPKNYDIAPSAPPSYDTDSLKDVDA